MYSGLTTSHILQLQALLWSTGNRHSSGFIFLTISSEWFQNSLHPHKTVEHYHSVRLPVAMPPGNEWRPVVRSSSSGQWRLRLPFVWHWAVERHGLYSQHYYLKQDRLVQKQAPSNSWLLTLSEFRDLLFHLLFYFPKKHTIQKQVSACFIYDAKTSSAYITGHWGFYSNVNSSGKCWVNQEG